MAWKGETTYRYLVIDLGSLVSCFRDEVLGASVAGMRGCGGGLPTTTPPMSKRRALGGGREGIVKSTGVYCVIIEVS